MTTAATALPEPPRVGASSVLATLRSPSALSREVLAGILTALALVPEVISFSFIAGVDPKVSLVASIVLALTMSVLGGRPAMVTAAAGAVALVIGPLVKAYGIQYVLPTVLLAGAIQLGFGAVGLARLTRFVPRSVMIGFVNGLGILIFAAQVPHIVGVPWMVYPLFALSVAIILVLPRFTSAVPAPLIAIIAATAIAMAASLAVPSVGGDGRMAPGLPGITPLLVPLDLETLKIIWPTALSVAFVGLLETLLTAKLVDELTDTASNKSREASGLGLANLLAGFYGGIGGCAMIAQTIVNVKFGRARTRISTAVAGLMLLGLVTGLSEVMARIPMAALAAVMMIAALRTINWQSLRPSTFGQMPKSETGVMLVTVAVVVTTGNLAIGVVSGVILAMVLFARRVAYALRAERLVSEDGQAVRYTIHGPLFFGSTNDLVERFSYAADPARVTIDLSHAQVWDASSVAVLDGVAAKYRELGAVVSLTGLDARSALFHERLTGRL